MFSSPNGRQECFPEVPDAQQLPSVITPQQIEGVLADEHAKLLNRVRQHFKLEREDRQRILRQRQYEGLQSVLTGFRDTLRRVLATDWGNRGFLMTYGDLRQAGRTMQEAVQRWTQSVDGDDLWLVNRVMRVYVEARAAMLADIAKAGANAIPAPAVPQTALARAPAFAEAGSSPPLPPLTKALKDLHPSEIKTYLDGIAERSLGDEWRERSLVEELGIPWDIYRMWKGAQLDKRTGRRKAIQPNKKHGERLSFQPNGHRRKSCTVPGTDVSHSPSLVPLSPLPPTPMEEMRTEEQRQAPDAASPAAESGDEIAADGTVAGIVAETAEGAEAALEGKTPLPPAVRQRVEELFAYVQGRLEEKEGRLWRKSLEDQEHLVDLAGYLCEYSNTIPELSRRTANTINTYQLRKLLPKVPSLSTVEQRVLEYLSQELKDFGSRSPRTRLKPPLNGHVLCFMRLQRKRDLGTEGLVQWLDEVHLSAPMAYSTLKRQFLEEDGTTPRSTEQIIPGLYEKARRELYKEQLGRKAPMQEAEEAMPSQGNPPVIVEGGKTEEPPVSEGVPPEVVAHPAAPLAAAEEHGTTPVEQVAVLLTRIVEGIAQLRPMLQRQMADDGDGQGITVRLPRGMKGIVTIKVDEDAGSNGSQE